MPFDYNKFKKATPPKDLPFDIRKIGHVVLMVSDMDRSVDFCTRTMGFRISDVYPEDMVPGGWCSCA